MNADSGKPLLALQAPAYQERNAPLDEKFQSKLDASGSIQTNAVTNSLLALDKELPLATNNATVTLATASSPAALPPAPVVASDVLTVTRPESESTAKARAMAPANFNAKKFARTQALTPSGLLKGLPDGPVLNSFQVETTGDQVRIVDSDGSVYAGRLESGKDTVDGVSVATAAASEPATRDLNARRFSDALQPAPPPVVATRKTGLPTVKLFFRVSGTNLTLKRPVVFKGNFAGNAAPIAEAAFGGTGGGAGAVAKSSNAPAPLRLMNLRIQGRAVIGTNQLDILADPVDAP